MPHAYSVIFNGASISRHTRKGDALDAAYQHVNTAQHTHAKHAAKGSAECRVAADRLGRLLGVLASTIPDCRRSRFTGRFVLNVSESGQTVTVRRDAI
jgi:hypothetical protein